ncbi:uncharacterized protein PAC_05225 [Phialocephala subalpina]|uniref:Peptidase A1 domain-containing protein n=1 Tax=Phialocephala subalpina TaxID=576137 RepID=A0A1L7WRE7_9HELO|nr:uncharacterized protein PAC_05225 [Phialocephala subalpina]
MANSALSYSHGSNPIVPRFLGHSQTFWVIKSAAVYSGRSYLLSMRACQIWNTLFYRMLCISILLWAPPRPFEVHPSTPVAEEFHINTITPVLWDNETKPSSSVNVTASLPARLGMANFWYITLKVGSPGQDVSAMVDTGSADLVIASSLLPHALQRWSAYDIDASNTAEIIPREPWVTSYGDPSNPVTMTGRYVDDIVSVGSICVYNIEFQVIELVDRLAITGFTPYLPSILGLFASRNSQYGITRWLTAVMDHTVEQVFAIDFQRGRSNGSIDFGYIDNSKFRGEIVYTPVIPTVVDAQKDIYVPWIVSIDGLYIGQFYHWLFKVVLDTGKPRMQFPRWALDRYFQDVPNSAWNEDKHTYEYPCQTKLKSFRFGIGGSYYWVHPRWRYIHHVRGGDTCVWGSLEVCDDLCIWGLPVIEDHFVVFDYGKRRVGFAKKLVKAEQPPLLGVLPRGPWGIIA